MKVDYDVITIGGGLGGAALAKVLAENGRARARGGTRDHVQGSRAW